MAQPPDIQTDRIEPVDTTFPSINELGHPNRDAVLIQSGYEDYSAEQFLAAEFLIYNLMSGTETMFVGSSENSLRFFEKAMDYGWKGIYCHCPPTNFSDQQDNGIIIQHIFKDWLSGEKPMGALCGGTRFWRAIGSSKSKIILDVQLTPPRIDSYPCFQCSEKDGDFLYVSRFEGLRLQRLERVDESWYAKWWRQNFLNQPLMPYDFPFPSCLMQEETVGMWDMTTRWKLSQSGADLISSGHCMINVKAVEDVCVTSNAETVIDGEQLFPRYVVDYYGRQLLAADGVHTHFVAAASKTVDSTKKEDSMNVSNDVINENQCSIISHSECAEVACEIFKSGTNMGGSQREVVASNGSSARSKDIFKYLASFVGKKNVASIVVLDREVFSRPATQVDLRAATTLNESNRQYITETIIPMLKQQQQLGCNDRAITLYPDYHMALHKLCRSKRIIPRYGPVAMNYITSVITQGVLQFIASIFGAWGVGYTNNPNIFVITGLIPYPGNFLERATMLNFPFTPWSGKRVVQFFLLNLVAGWFFYVPGLPFMLFGWKGGLTSLETVNTTESDSSGGNFNSTTYQQQTKEVWVRKDDEYSYITWLMNVVLGTIFFDLFVKKMVSEHNLPKYMIQIHDDFNSMNGLPFILPILTMAFGNFLTTTFESQFITSTYISLGFASMEALTIILIDRVFHRIWYEEICKVEEDIDRTRGLNNLSNGSTVGLNPYPCGIDRLCDMPVQIPNPMSESVEADKNLFRARRHCWMEERERIETSKKNETSNESSSNVQQVVPVIPSDVSDSTMNRNNRLSIQAERNLTESGIFGLNCHHVAVVHSTYELCRLFTLLYTAMRQPKGSYGIISSIMLSSIQNSFNRLGIPRVLVITFFPESAKVFFLPTTFNKVHDACKFGVGYCRFWLISAIIVARAILFDQKYDPYNEIYYRTYLDQESGEKVEKDRLDPNQVDYGCFCWNGNVLNCLIWMLVFEMFEDEIVGLLQNNKKLKALSACVLGYCYDHNLIRMKESDHAIYSDFDKLHHHRLYVKSTDGQILVKKSDSESSNPENSTVTNSSNFDFLVSIIRYLVSCSKFGREALSEYGNYVASPRCRHLKLYATIRGGSSQCELFQHSIGPSPLLIMAVASLTMGLSEFFGDRPSYSYGGSFRVGEVFVAMSRIHDDSPLFEN